MEKESEDFLIDYEFISKYIRDDTTVDKEKKENNERFLSKYIETEKKGEVEVFSIGDGEDYSEKPNSFKGRFKKDPEFEEEIQEKIESSSPISEAKKEFMEYLEDDSLTLDTAMGVNHDWNKN